MFHGIMGKFSIKASYEKKKERKNKQKKKKKEL